MRSGFKMKQSPAKRGDIQGTSGHASALKASPARIGGVLKLGSLANKVRTYFKGAKKVKDVVKTTKKKIDRRKSKQTLVDEAYQDGVNSVPNVKPDGLVKKAMTKTGVATTGYGAYKLGDWLWGSGSTDAKANNTNETENKIPLRPINDKNFKNYKRK
tara:strand:+ start:234 stop:707 length:474 start_codon:yes stop_codon:yes gene_type:complete